MRTGRKPASTFVGEGDVVADAGYRPCRGYLAARERRRSRSSPHRCRGRGGRRFRRRGARQPGPIRSMPFCVVRRVTTPMTAVESSWRPAPKAWRARGGHSLCPRGFGTVVGGRCCVVGGGSSRCKSRAVRDAAKVGSALAEDAPSSCSPVLRGSGSPGRSGGLTGGEAVGIDEAALR